ncbi:hypothetical protein M9458_052021, partial [Cirrhinus mrigala]
MHPSSNAGLATSRKPPSRSARWSGTHYKEPQPTDKPRNTVQPTSEPRHRAAHAAPPDSRRQRPMTNHGTCNRIRSFAQPQPARSYPQTAMLPLKNQCFLIHWCCFKSFT